MGAGATLHLVGSVDTAQQRYLRIVEDLLERFSQAETGRQLGGLSQAQISFYKNGTNKPDLRAIGLAVDALHISWRYFFDEKLVDPQWREFQSTDDEPAEGFDWQRYVSESDTDAWRRFAERYLARFVREGLSDEQIAQLRAQVFRGGPPMGPGAYVDYAEMALRRPEGETPPGFAAAAKAHKSRRGSVKTGRR